MVSIQNNFFTAGIRLEGAELASLIETSSGREIIWNADPEVWGSSAPVLFPVIANLKNGQTQIHGKTYSLPAHGVLRDQTATVVEQGDDVVTLQFESNPQTLERYPFPFIFQVTFRLSDNELAVTYKVHNTGQEPMLFSVGSHPAFALDVEQYSLADHVLEFSEAESLDLYGVPDGLMVKREDRYLENEKHIVLSETLFDNDALIFQNVKSRTVRLHPLGIEVDLLDNPHLGIWAKPGAAYVCIEPWLSCPDAPDSDGHFKNKPDIMSLAAGDSFTTGYSIRKTLCSIKGPIAP